MWKRWPASLWHSYQGMVATSPSPPVYIDNFHRRTARPPLVNGLCTTPGPGMCVVEWTAKIPVDLGRS